MASNKSRLERVTRLRDPQARRGYDDAVELASFSLEVLCFLEGKTLLIISFRAELRTDSSHDTYVSEWPVLRLDEGQYIRGERRLESGCWVCRNLT